MILFSALDRLGFIRLLAKIVMLVGLIVMVAWSLGGIYSLTTILQGKPSMKFATALIFLLSGFLLYMLSRTRANGQPTPYLAMGLIATSILAVMGAVFAAGIFHISFEWENVLLQQNPWTPRAFIPGFPSLGTVVGAGMISLVCLLSVFFRKFADALFLYGGSVVSFIGARAVVGYVFNVPVLYFLSPGLSDGMSIHTALLFVFMGTGFFLLGRDYTANPVPHAVHPIPTHHAKH